MLNPASDSSYLQVLSVYLDEQIFGIPIRKVRDVLETLQLTDVPGTSSFIAGVANLRGRIVTAIDLGARISQIETIRTRTGMNVVLESNGELFSIIVDRVGDVLTLETAKLEDIPMTLNPAWRKISQGIHQLNNSLMIVLDAEKIIYDE